jgi:hypothetical protein
MAKRFKNIKEPVGGLNGMAIQKAMLFAMTGQKVRRVDWPKERFVYCKEGDRYVFYLSVGDYVSCDWYIVE